MVRSLDLSVEAGVFGHDRPCGNEGTSLPERDSWKVPDGALLIGEVLAAPGYESRQVAPAAHAAAAERAPYVGSEKIRSTRLLSWRQVPYLVSEYGRSPFRIDSKGVLPCSPKPLHCRSGQEGP